MMLIPYFVGNIMKQIHDFSIIRKNRNSSQQISRKSTFNMFPFTLPLFSTLRRIAASSFDPALKKKPQSLRESAIRTEKSNTQEVVEVEDPNDVSLGRHYSESQEQMVRFTA